MKIAVIVGSVRQGRVTDRVAKWVAAEAKTIDGAKVEIVDLADHVLPLFDEAVPPQYNPERQPEGAVKKWLDALAVADAFVIVTPEYNRAYPGVLKNALDFIDFQFVKKPVAIVAHGSTGGAQAVAGLRITLPALKAAVLSDATFVVGPAGQLFDEAGELEAEAKANPYGPQAALKNTITQLGFYGKLLIEARASE
jgi:NAD(P)H-dependent FMN reductase